MVRERIRPYWNAARGAGNAKPQIRPVVASLGFSAGRRSCAGWHDAKNGECSRAGAVEQMWSRSHSSSGRRATLGLGVLACSANSSTPRRALNHSSPSRPLRTSDKRQRSSAAHTLGPLACGRFHAAMPHRAPATPQQPYPAASNLDSVRQQRGPHGAAPARHTRNNNRQEHLRQRATHHACSAAPAQ